MDDSDTRPAIGSAEQSRKPAWLLGLLIAIAACGFAFLTLGSVVTEGDSRGIDRAILVGLRVPGHLDTPRGPHWLRESVTDLSSLGSPTVLSLMVLLTCGYLLARQRARLMAVVLAVIGSGALMGSLFKAWFDRARPEVVPHLVPAYSLSFPSGHATDSAMVYLTLAMLIMPTQPQRAARIFLLASALLLSVTIGLTRLYLGVHWPSDVVAGWMFGWGWALLGHLGTRVLKITG